MANQDISLHYETIGPKETVSSDYENTSPTYDSLDLTTNPNKTEGVDDHEYMEVI